MTNLHSCIPMIRDQSSDDLLEVTLSGVEMSILMASDMVNSWPFRLNAPREKLSEIQRRTIRRIAEYLYEVRKRLLVAAGVFLPPVTLVPTREYASKRATVQASVHLTREDICTCLIVLRFCHEELSGDPEDWQDFCSISSSSLAHFDLSLTDLCDLVNKLEKVVCGASELISRHEEQIQSACEWPPRGSVAIFLKGVEFELLTGALILLNGWIFLSPVAQTMLVQSEQDIASSISKYLLGEQQSQLRAAAALIPPTLPAPSEFVAAQRTFTSQHFLMREHLQVCISALLVCEEEFREHWVDFCQSAPSGLYRFNPAPEELPRLTAKLRRLWNGESADA
jgi:hypothetical protein